MRSGPCIEGGDVAVEIGDQKLTLKPGDSVLAPRNVPYVWAYLGDGPAMWVTTTDFPTAASHPFYRRLNQLLREHGFDDFAEAQCAASGVGRTARRSPR